MRRPPSAHTTGSTPPVLSPPPNLECTRADRSPHPRRDPAGCKLGSTVPAASRRWTPPDTWGPRIGRSRRDPCRCIRGNIRREVLRASDRVRTMGGGRRSEGTLGKWRSTVQAGSRFVDPARMGLPTDKGLGAGNPARLRRRWFLRRTPGSHRATRPHRRSHPRIPRSPRSYHRGPHRWPP